MRKLFEARMRILHVQYVRNVKRLLKCLVGRTTRSGAEPVTPLLSA
jgi:hypothetical protein